ncbi:MAG: ketopantoate reductase family protein [Aminivibrio sp.]|jgi:2-dehydropantoate 2-reductase|nr:2-dehydropantoate 2-reductase [Synergistaceae bacterium]
MKIAFVGLGGVGGYYGGKVARAFEGGAEHQVAFMARGEHLAAIKEKGLEVRAKDGTFFAKPFMASDDPAKIGKADLVVFAVKGYDLRAAALAAAPLVGPDTAVLPLLNGADNNEILKEALPPCKVLNGCVYISARIEAPGVVVQSGGNCKLFFGAPGAGAEEFRPLEEMFKRAGIDATLARNIDEEVWTKFIFLSPFAGVTSLFGKNFGEVLSGADSRPMLEGMMKEIRTLAGLRGVSLPGDIVEQSLAKGEAFPPDTKSSMQLDCERGKRTEIEPLLGFVVREGERLGADVPLTRGVYDALRMRMELPCGGDEK